MKKNASQKQLQIPHEEVLEFNTPLYYEDRKSKFGHLTQLALEPGSWKFKATRLREDLFELVHENGLKFIAELKEGKGSKKGTYRIDGCVKNKYDNEGSFFDGFRIDGRGENGERLRPAQIGAIYALLSHWSLSQDVSTIVLPTGTGKTETMLVATLADKAKRTLVVVPTIDLKIQLAEKFSNWGILRKLGVIPQDTLNPKVLVLNKTLSDLSCIESIREADVVISTPALIARADDATKNELSSQFTHVYFDEAHHVKANEWDAIKQLFSQSKIVQFTATPYRNDRKPIEGVLIYNYPLSQALKDKCFAKISLVSIEERHPRKKDKAIADAAMTRLLEDREKGWSRHRMMVRAENRLHANALYQSYQIWFPEERVVLVHSGVKGRKAIVEKIKQGHYDIIVCVDMLKEGFDYPEFKIAAVHGMHKSLSVLLQFIGRFARTEDGLGDASFIVNFADEKISVELENLFQEGAGWEKVISEIADAKKTEAESLLAFLQGCEPYSGFDSPDISLNPKLVYPALSCRAFKADSFEWKYFKDSFNLNKYAISHPYINKNENIFYFATQKRDKVKWAKSEKMRDQKWDLIVMHQDTSSSILYVGFSEKRLDVEALVESITQAKPIPITGDPVFRSFDSIKRLSIVHAGIFKPANHLHRYSRLSGADVTTELTRWKEGKRCQKSDFVGVGFRDGFPVSVGASVKGKIWSPARVGDLSEWKSWCLKIGSLITDESINSDQLLEDSAEKKQIEVFELDQIVLATDWAEELYPKIHKITLGKSRSESILLSECALLNKSVNGNRADFSLTMFDEEIAFSIVLGGERGHSVEGLDESEYIIEGLKGSAIPLKQFFEENPPTMFLLNGCTIAGCIYTDYGESLLQLLPRDQIETLSWTGVDFRIESMYKSMTPREKSIQEYMMNYHRELGAKIVFNDDNSGESADIVAIYQEEDSVRFEMVHCKYSKEKAGARKSDLYEVCGQAIVSLRYKWKPEELLKHMARRNGAGILKGKRFYIGSESDLETVKQALKYSEVSFGFAIAQPGVKSSGVTSEMVNFLGSINSTVVEMTETKLKCYFSG